MLKGQDMKSLEDKIGQMLVVGFHGLEAPEHILDWLDVGKISGVILFARNIENPQQVAALCKSIHEAAKYPALIAIDQEGGMVARLRERNGFTESPGAMALASAQNNEIQTEIVSAVLGAEMQALGINWNYAPSVDVSYNAQNPTVGTRSFGNDSEFVSQIATAAVRGFQKRGVAACAKHFPGLGDTAIDTHLELAAVDTDIDYLLKNDLLPYRAAIEVGLASIMTTHTLFTTLDEIYPATLSPHIIQRLIREELAYDGVVVSDCMEMRAISDNYGATESSVLGMLAGLDIILMSHTVSMQEEAYQAMLDAAHSGRVSLEIIDRANARIEQLKTEYKISPQDISAVSIANEEHRQRALMAARAGLTVVKQNTDLLPMPERGKAKIALIEFASHMDSEVMERNEATAFSALLQETRPDIEIISINLSSPSMEITAQAQKLASSVDILLLATRNAHMMPAQKNIAEDLLKRTENSVLIALRNPYDAGALSADAMLCSNGDSSPSLAAVIEALQGKFLPSGKLPVEID
jgi:beta-N-acetylhexosaminidase